MNTTLHTPIAHAPLRWKITRHTGFNVAEFTITEENGILSPAHLSLITLPQELQMSEGLVLSGRGPVWLYGFLTHLAHPFKWVAIYDPRLQAAVVIERHSVDAPGVGSLIPLPQEQS